MYHSPSHQPDRGHSLLEMQIVEDRANKARIEALETLIAEMASQIAELQLRVHQMRHRLRMDQ
jgi:uncharacterized coiled-coil protein SlyX